ncbi:MAG: M16 family metallopeptidase, partial [Nannocystaceae bacterium]
MPTRFPLLAPSLALCLAAVPGCRPDASTTPQPTPDHSQANGGGSSILAASGLPTPHAAPLPGDKMGVTIHRLQNGLTVYISTDRQKPRFNAWIAVRAGSRHDPAASTGLAHYLEHMLFKGTDEFGTRDYEAERPHLEQIAKLYTQLRENQDPGQREALLKQLDEANQASGALAIPNEFDRMYKRLGIEGLNAFTSDEQTVYIADVPSNRLEAWAKVEAERFADPTFRQFFTEIEAVYEEKNLSLDNPWSRTDETLMLGMYPAHPYGTQPTIGTSEHLKNPAYQDMVDFFHRWYVPNNMAIVLAGDIDAETALPVLEQTIGTWQPKALEKPEPGQITPLTARAQREVTVEGSEGVMLAWHTV